MTDAKRNVDGTINARPLVGVHYLLEGYVCGAGCFKGSPFEGWATFTQIFQQRPAGCRYAVARLVPVFGQEPDGAWICWDLYETPTLNNPRTVNSWGTWVDAPEPKWTAPNAEALIMKAGVLYDRE